MTQRIGIRLWFAAIVLLCLAAVGLSLLQMTAPQAFSGDPAPAASGAPEYLVRDQGGRVAVYTVDADGNETGGTVYDIYVNLLPEPDVLRLRQGIRVTDGAALQQLLEDLGA